MRLLAQFRAARGQNMMELVLTLGFMVVLILTTIEVGRVWMTYNATQSAALDGVVTASQHHNAANGEARIDARLNQANIPIVNRSVVAVNNDTGYQASITVNFQPMFGGMSIPTPGGNIPIVPDAFPISFSTTQYTTVY